MAHVNVHNYQNITQYAPYLFTFCVLQLMYETYQK